MLLPPAIATARQLLFLKSIDNKLKLFITNTRERPAVAQSVTGWVRYQYKEI